MRSLKLFAVAAVTLSLFTSIAVAVDSTLTNATLFRGDGAGNNLNGVGTAVAHGAWTTVLDQQNVPGNFGGQLFLSRSPNPGPNDFLSPSALLAIPLSVGANTFYFWANSDDALGGNATFGLNVFLNDTIAANPTLSGFTSPGTGQALLANASSLTAGFDFQYALGSGTLSFNDGVLITTLTSFEVTGVGGQPATAGSVDLTNSTNTIAFTPPPRPDGITDTYGKFTLTVTDTGNPPPLPTPTPTPTPPVVNPPVVNPASPCGAGIAEAAMGSLIGLAGLLIVPCRRKH